MASTYSNLKIQLMATGENNTTWGNVTNVNLGTAIEEAIVGSADVTFASGDVTLTLTDTNATQTARNLRLNLTGTTGGARNLIVPAIEKAYIINNGTADTVTVKNSTGTGIAVPAGKTMWVYNNAINVVDVTTHISSLTLGTPLAAIQGGTGQNSYAVGDILYANTTTTLAKLADVATGNALISGGVGTAPSWGKIGLTTHVSDTLPVANGGTGQNSYTNGQLLIGNSTGNTLDKATLTAGSGISITNGSGSITIATTGSVTSVDVSGGTTGLTTSGGPVTSSGTITIAGTLNVANGGTGATTLTGIVKGNGTSAFSAATAGTDYVAPGTATNFTALQTFTGTSSNMAAKLINALEKVTVSATAATGTINFDVTTQSVLYYTTNASGNWTLNFRASSGTSLDTALATGESVTVAFLVTQGSTAYYNTTVQVDGSSVTPKWQGAVAPAAGNASGIDVYAYTIIKTGSATFTVLASQTQFA